MWRVGMIDDETMAVQFLESLIDWNAHGYEVVGHALTASSAVMMTQEKKPDLLFMDICMPGENGLSLARRILEIQPGCQIVFLTSFREFDYSREALELGVAAFVLKYEMNPTRLVQLLEEIRPKLEKVGQQKTQVLLRWLDACAEGNALDEAPFDPAKQYAFVIRRAPCSWGVKNTETQAEQSGLQALLAHSKTKDGDMLALFEQEAFGSVCSVRRRAEELAVALCQRWQASTLVVHPFRSNRMEWTKRIP